jgi:nicotinamidase/pyrazinamidase
MTATSERGHAMERTERFRDGDGLLIVDVQNDFCAGGALPVPDGDAVVPVLNDWIAAAGEAGVPVFASRDWHPENHSSFQAQGGPWPPHCVQGTPGAAFHPELKLPPDAVVVSKGTDPETDGYSVFAGTDFAARLHERGVSRLWIGGLARDYCVRASALDAIDAGVEVRVIVPATRGIAQPEDGADHALTEMANAGATLDERAAP